VGPDRECLLLTDACAMIINSSEVRAVVSRFGECFLQSLRPQRDRDIGVRAVRGSASLMAWTRISIVPCYQWMTTLSLGLDVCICALWPDSSKKKSLKMSLNQHKTGTARAPPNVWAQWCLLTLTVYLAFGCVGGIVDG